MGKKELHSQKARVTRLKRILKSSHVTKAELKGIYNLLRQLQFEKFSAAKRKAVRGQSAELTLRSSSESK